MSHIDPKPNLASRKPNERFSWVIAAEEQAHWRETNRIARFFDVVQGRRSSRELKAAPIELTMNAVRDALQIFYHGSGETSDRQRKPVLSAGALHPIQALVIRREGGPLLYDDISDKVLSVAVSQPAALADFCKVAQKVLPNAIGDWILLTADFDRTAASYDSADSLVWRDAGAALQMLALTCQVNGLGFCPLGLLGDDAAHAIHGRHNGPQGVGVAAVWTCNGFALVT